MSCIANIASLVPESIIDVVIDFESYYDSECSLSKLSTTEYVMHPDFEVIGASIKINGGAARWVVGYDKLKVLFDNMPWHRIRLICHNMGFDGVLLDLIFGARPAIYYCTMMASRPMVVPFSQKMSLDAVSKWIGASKVKGGYVVKAHGKHLADFSPYDLECYGEYAIGDADLCWEIYQYTRHYLNDDEQLMIHLTCLKSTAPQLVADIQTLSDALVDEKLRKESVLKRAGITRDEIMSNNLFSKALQNCGISPPMKISPTTGKPTLALSKQDSEFLDLLDHPNDNVRLLVEARLGAKSTIEETRLERFMKVAECRNGQLPFPLLWYAAMTGRNGGTDKMNLQNLTKGSALRRAIRAPRGHKLVVSDLSQIEARMVAWLAGQDDLVAAFRNNEEIYCGFYNDTFGANIVKSDEFKAERFIGKVAVLSLMYASGAEKFNHTVNISGIATITSEDAKRVVDSYRSKYWRIKQLWYTYERALETMIAGGTIQIGPVRFTNDPAMTLKTGQLVCCIELPAGRKLYYPELYIDATGEKRYRGNKGEWKRLYGGAVLENISQALAQLFIRDSELRVAVKTSLRITAAGQVHDELIYCVPEAVAERFAAVLTKEMTTPPSWAGDFPLACETHIGDNYADAK